MGDYKDTGCFMKPRTKMKISLRHKLEAGAHAQTGFRTFNIFFCCLDSGFPCFSGPCGETKLTCPMICHKRKDQASFLVSVPNSSKGNLPFADQGSQSYIHILGVVMYYFLLHSFLISSLKREEIETKAKVSLSRELL